MQSPIDKLLHRPGSIQGGAYSSVRTPMDSFLGDPSNTWTGGARWRGNSGSGWPSSRISDRPTSGWKGKFDSRFAGIRGKMAGGIDTGMSRLGSFSRREANIMGRTMNYGEIGVRGGLGLLAGSQAMSSFNRMRMGDLGGAALHGGLAVAAGMAAYNHKFTTNAIRKGIKSAAAFAMKHLR